MARKQSPNLLKFAHGNAKLDKSIYTFSLPSGYTCPGAKDCLAKANVDTGQITDGPDMKFRCFSATAETRPPVRKARWHNFFLLTSCLTRGDMVDLIEASIPEEATKIRIHVGGDFYSQTYFDAWLDVAQRNPNITFYAYTKSIPFVHARLEDVEKTSNFRLTSSAGGKFDVMARDIGMIKAEVVLHPEDAEAKGLEIDHDDTHAIENDKDFALLIHGTQPKDSPTAEALKRLRQEKVEFGYSATKSKTKPHVKETEMANSRDSG